MVQIPPNDNVYIDMKQTSGSIMPVSRQQQWVPVRKDTELISVPHSLVD